MIAENSQTVRLLNENNLKSSKSYNIFEVKQMRTITRILWQYSRRHFQFSATARVYNTQIFEDRTDAHFASLNFLSVYKLMHAYIYLEVQYKTQTNHKV